MIGAHQNSAGSVLLPEKGDTESVEYSDSYSDDYEVDRLEKSFELLIKAKFS